MSGVTASGKMLQECFRGARQVRLWIELLMRFLPDRATVEEVLQAFQGAVLAFLITGDREPGRRAVMRMLENQEKVRSRA